MWLFKNPRNLFKLCVLCSLSLFSAYRFKFKVADIDLNRKTISLIPFAYPVGS